MSVFINEFIMYDEELLGLPFDIKPFVKWVEYDAWDDGLPNFNGYTNLIIEYTNGKILGFKNISEPAFYLRNLIKKEFSINYDSNEIKIVKQNLSRIFAKKIKITDVKQNEFEETWSNVNSDILPYDNLEKYCFTSYDKYLKLFISNIEFAKLYL